MTEPERQKKRKSFNTTRSLLHKDFPAFKMVDLSAYLATFSVSSDLCTLHLVAFSVELYLIGSLKVVSNVTRA